MRLALSDILKFDIADIDNGHERIILMLNEIGDCLETRNFDAAWCQTLHLIAVERSHARLEADLLEKHHYTDIRTHNEYHVVLNKALNMLAEALNDADGERAIWLHHELCEAFMDDLLKADLPFKSLMQHVVLRR